MKKVRRFNGEDGSEVSDEDANQFREDQTARMMRLARGESGNAPAALTSRSIAPVAAEPAEAEPAAAPAAAAPKAKPAIVTKEQLQAFKAEYGADKDLTDYMNKQQGLKRRNAPLPSTPSAPSAPSAPSGRGPTVEKAQALEAQSLAEKARRAAMEKSQALEAVYPEQALLGGAGFGIKSIAKAAKDLANRGGVKEVAKRVEPTFRETEKQLALPKPTPRLGYDKAGAKAAERSGRAAEQRSEMLKENLKRYGMTERTSPDAINAVRENLGMGRGFKVMKKGGSVKGYASGGSVSSASKRADGCAIRGKTRA